MQPRHTFGYCRPSHRPLTNVPIVRSQYPVIGSNSLKLWNLNTGSIKSKSADFLCYVQSCATDIFAITETWFTDRDSAHRVEVTPTGYKLYDHARSGRTGGGTALMCCDNLGVTKVAVGEKRSFEFSEWIILGQGSHKVRIVVVYRLQYSPNHPVTTGVFFEEFSDYLESIIFSSEPLLVTDDFNIHVDVVGDPDREKFLELLETIRLQQHVVTPTHESRHTLDLIITRQCENLVKTTPVSDYHISDHWSVTCLLNLVKTTPVSDYHISDHWSVTCLVNLDKPNVTRKTVTFGRIKGVDLAALSNEFSSSDLCMNTPDTLSELVDCYNTALSSALDRHAPLVTRTIPPRPLVPWFNDEIKEARRQRRKVERRSRRKGLVADLRAFKDLRNKTNNLINDARRVFYRDLIDENSGDQKKLFSIAKRLLGAE